MGRAKGSPSSGVAFPVIYMVLGLLMLLIGGGAAVWFALQNRELRERMAREQGGGEPSEELRREQAIRRNLQRICDRRSAEVQKLRGEIREYEGRIQELENQITQLNVNLFQESGRRILAEKDEGARRMRQELADKQLAEAKDKLRRQQADARKREEELLGTIDGLRTELDRLRARRARHSARRASAAPENQITMDELLEGEKP